MKVLIPLQFLQGPLVAGFSRSFFTGSELLCGLLSVSLHQLSCQVQPSVNLPSDPDAFSWLRPSCPDLISPNSFQHRPLLVLVRFLEKVNLGRSELGSNRFSSNHSRVQGQPRPSPLPLVPPGPLGPRLAWVHDFFGYLPSEKHHFQLSLFC